MALATLRRLGLVLLVAGALCAPATAALAQAPKPVLPPGIGVKLLQAPPDSVNNPRAHDYIIDHVAPGTTISRQIGVSNGDPQPVYLSFYPVAATIGGGIFAPGAGHAANDLTSWTTMSPASATVEPGQTLAVTVRIAVPADATSGEHYGAVLAQDTTPPAAGGGITSVSRVGIRIYLSVGPGGAPITAFTINSMTAERDSKGDPLVTAQVHNTGGRAVDLSGQLQLTNGPSSLSAGPFPVQAVETLAPGQSGQVAVRLDAALPDGPWDARMTLFSGLTSSTGTARLTFPAARGGAGATVVAAGAQPGHSAMSGALVAAAALAAIALLILLLLVVRRRRRHGRPGRGGTPKVSTDRTGLAAPAVTSHEPTASHPLEPFADREGIAVTPKR